MSDVRRLYIPGGAYFFTLVTHKRRRVFTDNATVELLRAAVRHAMTVQPFEAIAAVILPDHLHTIWTLPNGDDDFASRWSRIKGAFTRAYLAAGGDEGRVTQSQAAEGRRAVWQRRFFEHAVRDEDELTAMVEYIHYNPVRHGLVNCPKDWPWSSFHRFVERGVYPVDWCCGSEPPGRLRAEGDRWE